MTYPAINAPITIIKIIPTIRYLMLPKMNSNINENMLYTILLNRQIRNNIPIPINTNMIIPITERECNIHI